jgi:hypothetical protein
MDLRVLGRTSSINVRKVLWALDELAVVYSREDWVCHCATPMSLISCDSTPMHRCR